MKTDSNKFGGIKSYFVMTGLAFFTGLFITSIQVVFVLPVPTGFCTYLRLMVSALATICLLVGILLFRLNHRTMLYIAGVGSMILIITMLELLVRIAPTAQGNIDPSEFLWFLVLPMILFISQAFLAI